MAGAGSGMGAGMRARPRAEPAGEQRSMSFHAVGGEISCMAAAAARCCADLFQGHGVQLHSSRNRTCGMRISNSCMQTFSCTAAAAAAGDGKVSAAAKVQ